MKISKLFLTTIAAILVLTISSIIYLEVAYSYEFEEIEWEEDAGEDTFSDDENVLLEDDSADAMGKVTMEAEFLDGDILEISISAEEVIIPILGIAFHLEYEGEKIKFLRYEPGEFLERGGDPFYLVKNEDSEQKLVFGETLRRDDSFPLGEGQISKLYFQIIERDSLSFKFKNGVLSTLDTVRQDIDKIIWEDLELDKNGKKVNAELEGDELISQQLMTNNFNFSSPWAMAISMGLIIIILLTYIFLMKKRENKRHIRSVNFK